jgi:hypothetical protein
MKNIFKFSIVLLALSVVLAACSGGGGGGGGGGGAVAGTFTKTVALSATTGVNTGILGPDSFRHYQLLYKPADVAGSGYLSSLSLKRLAGSGATCSNVTIKLGHTDVPDLGMDMALNINQGRGAATTVLNNTTITIPASATEDFFEIPLSTSFNYNGVDNLVVDVTRTTACSGTTTLRAGTGSTTYDAYVYSVNIASPDTATVSSENAFHIKFNFAGGDNAIIQSGGAVLSYCAPFCNNAWRHLQTLHLASDINGSGRITGIGMVVDALSANATYTATIKLGHSQQNTLTSTDFATNFDYGAPVTVANNVVFTVPANALAGATLWLPVTSSFNYDGTHNLIVDIDVSSGSAVDTPWRATSIAGRSLYGTSGSTVGTGISSDAMHTKFRFAGGTMDVITSGANVLGEPFWNLENKIQFLYDASSLGTKGTISKIAFRLRYDAVPSDYSTFTVALGHTTRTTLSATYADNMDDRRVVFNGTLSIPASLKAGDWMEILLTTPFAYDSSKNLTIEASGLGGGVNYILTEDSARYTQHGRYSSGAGSITDDVANFVTDRDADLRFWMQ